MFEWLQELIMDLIKWMLVGVLDCSYWICLFICMAALLLYIGGIKGAAKWAGASFVINFVLQALRMVVK